MPIQKTCEYCGKVFFVRPSYARIRFCSHSCAMSSRKGELSNGWKGGQIEKICEFCRNKFLVYPNDSGRKYCSRTCYYNAKDQGKSYKSIYRDGKLIAVHRVTMEAHLGRPLRSDEDVHHINGDIRDNRLENLMLLSHSEHLRLESKQRSPEVWQKMTQARIGGKRTAETRAKMSAARRKWWERKRQGG